MPLELTAPPFIDRPVRPLVKGPITYQRVQRYLTHYPKQDPITGNVVLFLSAWVMHFFTNPDGSPGADASETVANYQITYEANNKEIIDLSSGAILYTRDKENDETWAALLAADPRPLAERGNAFGWQMQQKPEITQAAQIEAAMDAADGPPWYRFGRDEEPAA
ncbi:hypothetical protein Q5H92_08915 [Hymenobacter sp. M29]|uniref:Uncharacterized protein n=1 Tax=Hymenobacter mellowenesis TaxID=3063995 RepID=A0ABT9A9F5_9BACT|nr:hypothetical protein [Hymenobacter sp. M29]MDO7846476.1 hypothetical protein [Hymenobacter sp. M29]